MSFLSSSHIPQTRDHAGFAPDWMISAIGGKNYVDGLYQFPYTIGNRVAVEKVLTYLQNLLIKLGFDKIYGVETTGKLDEPTILSLKFAVGTNWEMMMWKDNVYALQVYVDNGDYYAAGEGDEIIEVKVQPEKKKETKIPTSVWVGVGVTAAVLWWLAD